MPAKNKTDNQLWEAAKTGDASAFTILFNHYWEKIYTAAFSYMHNKEICEEIVHDIFLNLWQKKETLNIHNFDAYVVSAARYHVYKALKSSYFKKIYFSTDPSVFPHQIDYNKGEQKLVFEEMESCIDDCIEQLPNRCSEIYKLSRKEYLSNDEIASKLNISKRTVENQITYALHQIRMFLKATAIFLLLCFFNGWLK